MTSKSDIFIYATAIVSCVVMTVLLTTSNSISYDIPESKNAVLVSETENQDPYIVKSEAYRTTERAVRIVEESIPAVKPGFKSRLPADRRTALKTATPVTAVAAPLTSPSSQAGETKRTEADASDATGEDSSEIDRIIIEVLLKNNMSPQTEPKAGRQDSVLSIYPDSNKPEGEDKVPEIARTVEYVVRDGDYLIAIASRNSVSVQDLMQWNSISNPDRIWSGQKLIVKKSAPQTVPEAPADTRLAKVPEGPKSAPSSSDFIWPTVSSRISSDYGMRRDPFDSSKIDFHPALDISARTGDPVFAVQNGKVVFSGQQAGYGNIVILRHDSGYLTVYAHNSLNLVRIGQFVTQGQLIAKVGSTGRSTASHLHFEVRKFTRPVNPATFLSRFLSRNME